MWRRDLPQEMAPPVWIQLPLPGSPSRPDHFTLVTLLRAGTGIQLSGDGRGPRQSYIYGRHKVTAMLEAGVRRTVVIHWEMPQA
jgi:hypothetical protein